MVAHFILFVSDQRSATSFYTAVLDKPPRLDVPGMSEFDLGGSILGLMPRSGAERLFDQDISVGEGRAELYLMVDDPQQYHQRALLAGAREISSLTPRDWGHNAAYSMDPWGYVIAFAHQVPTPDQAGKN